jgi:hypothetical protein
MSPTHSESDLKALFTSLGTYREFQCAYCEDRGNFMSAVDAASEQLMVGTPHHCVRSASTEGIRSEGVQVKQNKAGMTASKIFEGASVEIVGVHPWQGARGTAVAFETYGLGWKGWRIVLDNGIECYAPTSQLQKISS